MAKKQKKFRTRARLPRGFGDRSSADIRATDQMVAKIRKVYELYGFDPIETPFFEYSDALGKFLPDADRPNAGVFSLQDDDEQWMSLRYDLTAPLARHVAQNINDITLPYRTYRAGWVFRNEKPGPGRFRQFTQFDADIVGAPGVAADAEMAMMMADTMEALGIKRGDYIIRVNNRKVLDGVLEAIGLGGDKNEGRRLGVLRALDKIDRLNSVEIQKLLGGGRKDESGDWMDGLNLTSEQITSLNLLLAYQKAFTNKKAPSVLKRVIRKIQDTEKGAEIAYEVEDVPFESPFKGQNVNPYSNPDGILIAVSLLIGWEIQKIGGELEFAFGLPEKELSTAQKELLGFAQFIKHLRKAGYGSDRIQADISCVRGLEYYTGMVYEAELTFDVTNDKGQKVQFGSVGGGGRYDGLIERFTGQKVPATGFSIGVSRLMTALKNLGKLNDIEIPGPVVVCILDRDRIGDYQQMVAELRAAGIRAEIYQGNPKNFGKQLQYADKRNSPAAIIVGSDERERGVVQIKDLVEGKKAAAAIKDNQTWKAERPGQFEVDRAEMVAKISELPAVKAWLDRQK